MGVLLYDYFLFIYFYSKRYLRPKPLLRKRYYYELIEIIRHNNADLKKVTYPRLAEMAAECSVPRGR